MLVSVHPKGTGASVNLLNLSWDVMSNVLHCMSCSVKGFGGYKVVKPFAEFCGHVFAPVNWNDVPHGSGDGFVCLQIFVVTWASAGDGMPIARASVHAETSAQRTRLRRSSCCSHVVMKSSRSFRIGPL